MNTPENTNADRLSADQQRFQFLIKEAGLDFDEACYALGRHRGCLPEYRRLSFQEQLMKMQGYVDDGLTKEEAERIVLGSTSAPATGPRKAEPIPAKKIPTLDWMPAKKAMDQASPGRSRRGLLK